MSVYVCSFYFYLFLLPLATCLALLTLHTTPFSLQLVPPPCLAPLTTILIPFLVSCRRRFVLSVVCKELAGPTQVFFSLVELEFGDTPFL